MHINSLHRRLVSKCLHLWYETISRFFPRQGEIIMFHSIGDENSVLNIPYDKFETFLKSLSDKNVVRLENWEQATDFIALTIDDVPESFYLNAFPLLKKYGLPFTIFVSVSLLDTNGYITTSQFQEMASCDLCTVGSHGVQHVQFRHFTPIKALDDLKTSQQALSVIAGKKVEIYAFPYGSYFACGYKYKHLISKVYKYGFGTIAAPITKPRLMPFHFLPRINATDSFIRRFTKKT